MQEEARQWVDDHHPQWQVLLANPTPFPYPRCPVPPERCIARPLPSEAPEHRGRFECIWGDSQSSLLDLLPPLERGRLAFREVRFVMFPLLSGADDGPH